MLKIKHRILSLIISEYADDEKAIRDAVWTTMNPLISRRSKAEELLTVESLDQGSPPFLYLSINGKALLCFLGYLILGVAFYCFSDTQFSALDAVYYSVITLTTVGYGAEISVFCLAFAI